ncbi:MAG: hypothetical protein ACJAQT_004841 [Akkermansiaceae bacterium]|jgi:hypothetical protein
MTIPPQTSEDQKYNSNGCKKKHARLIFVLEIQTVSSILVIFVGLILTKIG